jgi:hypothetical protein
MSQHTTLDYDEANREDLLAKLAHQQAVARDAWTASGPMTPKQIAALTALQVEYDPTWTWIHASVELDLIRAGIPGLIAENDLVSHGIDPSLARTRVTDELRAAGLSMSASMHHATPDQQHLAEVYLQEYIEAQRLGGREPSLDDIAEMRARSLARIVLSTERINQKPADRAAQLERQRQVAEGTQQERSSELVRER